MRGRVIGTLAVLLAFVGAAYYALRLYAPCDDTYIYLVYVKNLFEGNGLTFNGDKVQGFTSSLWVAMIAAGGLVSKSLPLVAERLSLVSGLFALAMVYAVARRIGLSQLFSMLALLLVATTGDFAFYMSSGMETTLYTGMALASIYLTLTDRPSAMLRSIIYPLTLGLMVLTRPEGGVIAMFGTLYLAWRSRDFKGLVRCGIGVAIVILPAAIAAKVYYGSYLPNTYYAKSVKGFHNVGQGLTYLRFFVLHKAFIVLAILYLVRWRWRRLSTAVRWMALLSAVYFGYVVTQGGDNLIGHRAFLPLVPVLYVIVLAGFSHWRPALVATLLVLLSIGHVLNYNYGRVIGSSWKYHVRRHAESWAFQYEVRTETAQYIVDNYPPESVIALNAAGIIPYITSMRTVDMLGLNDKHIAREGKRDWSLAYGHQAGDADYVLRRRPTVILLGRGGRVENLIFLSDRQMWTHPLFRRFYRPAEFPNNLRAYVRQEEDGGRRR